MEAAAAPQRSALLGFLLKLDWFRRLFARQLSRPEGLIGQWVARLMNRSNLRMSERAVDHLRIQVNDQVLEIGFGGGPALRKLISLVGQDGQVVGIDRSPTMLARLEEPMERFITSGRLLLMEGEAERLRFEEKRFDGVLTVNTIYFWKDPVKVLSDIHWILKPGGRLVVAFRPAEIMRKLPFTEHGFELYSGEQVDLMLHQAGFSATRLEEENDDGMGYVCAVAVKTEASVGLFGAAAGRRATA